MSLTDDLDQPHDVADKVLRRARVSMMTRALQDRLALASIKISKGWENRSLDSIQPELDLQVQQRKRTASNADILSDTSSSVFSNALPTSSTGTAPIFSDELPPRSGSSHGSIKRIKQNPERARRSSGIQTRMRGQRSRASTTSWKAAHQLPQSSPTLRHSFNANTHSLSQPSFTASNNSTVVNSPSASEDDDQDIPLHSFQVTEPQFASSPPRTPPSTLSHSKFGDRSTKHNVQGTKEGADLLMFLASSPSTNIDYDRLDKVDKTPRLMNPPPQTPPSKHTALPSSMMNTPGTQGMFFGWNPHTPSANFNFGEFLNVTPSPAQGAFGSKTPGRTPGGLKTPSAARDTRRRLMFGASPRVGELTPGGGADLGIDLGGSLA
ncbi:MAG: hypothetical protein Q9162_003408 [Coniocarpon cinnabarinum]